MPNYQHLDDDQLSFITLQNVSFTKDTGFDSVCGLKSILAGGNMVNEMEINDLHLKIVEEPADSFRFRYKSEAKKGSHGGIKGENAIRCKKSYPTVKVENCPPDLGEQILIKVSIYTNNPVPKLHPFELVGKDANGKSLDKDFQAVFKSLIICNSKKEEVLEILKQRKKAEYDSKGLPCDEASVENEALEEMKSINLDSVKLCFEAFSKDDPNAPLCEKVFSQTINNQKSAATGDLRITRLSRCAGKCGGDDEVFLLCDKVKKEDIKVRFFEEESDWEAYGQFNPADIHHQVAIIFKTPPYPQNVRKFVFMELFRPSDGKCSEPRQFEYIPEEDGLLHTSNKKLPSIQTISYFKTEPSENSRKRKKMDPEENAYLLNSSINYSPSSTDDENILFDLNDLKGIEDIDFDVSLFREADISSIQGEMYPVEMSTVETLPTLLPSDTEIEKINTSLPPDTEIFNHSLPSYHINFLPAYVKADGINEISDSLNSLLLADQRCKQENENSETQKASSDFVSGIKAILESRDEKTIHHYVSHLIPLEDKDGNSLLHLGIKEQFENLNFILKMVKMAPEDTINHQNGLQETPLHLAVKGNHAKILFILLVCGGDPNIPDGSGNTCLHLAAKYGHLSCLKVLMPPSANKRTWKNAINDVDALNYDGMSALHLAVTGNSKDCVDFLLSSKADVNLPGKKSGQSSLHLAIENPSILQAILKQPNIDVYAEDFGGYTAVHLACLKIGKPFEVVSEQLEGDEDEIIKFLQSFHKCEDYDSRCSEAESDAESTDSSEFEDAVEHFGSTSSNGVMLKNAPTSKTCTNEKKSSLMKIEAELCRYLDRDGNWKKLANLIGLDTTFVAVLDEGLSPGQTVLRKIKDLYHPCQIQTIIEMLRVAELEEGAQILLKNSQC